MSNPNGIVHYRQAGAVIITKYGQCAITYYNKSTTRPMITYEYGRNPTITIHCNNRVCKISAQQLPT